jgi:hypothetical protein
MFGSNKSNVSEDQGLLLKILKETLLKSVYSPTDQLCKVITSSYIISSAEFLQLLIFHPLDYIPLMIEP